MATLIYRDKCQERIFRFADRLTDWGYPEQAKAVRAVAKGIKLVPTVKVPEWIPVNERKPHEFVSVLIYAPGEVPLPAVREAYFARGCWVTHITVLNEHEVTHWMEMPEGPADLIK